ncbi:MAG: histidine kinase [Bacteroidales bacterium]|nr:histidine kinase [Bacteroidales bacterium]
MSGKRQERIIYIIVWGLLFLAPLSALFTAEENAWSGIRTAWLRLLPFLALFLVHDIFLSGLYLHKKRKLLYAVLTLALITGFTLCMSRRTDKRPDPHAGPHMEQMHGPQLWTAPAWPPEGRPDGPPDGPPEDRKEKQPFFHPLKPEAITLILALLVIGLNLLVKMFFLSLEGERRMRELEQKHLETQLQYLRYQISPHFFMNTLNNIHALVDIDPEQAKSSILHLSKLMRYVLYEGDKPTIPLEKETDFLRQYVSLMRLRYNDTVQVSLALPENLPGMEIPPLLLITFVENAFKHGVSYESPSFIDVRLEAVDSGLHFTCRNSLHASKETRKDGGIGMENTRRRLDLIYEDRYRLASGQEDGVFTIDLFLPGTVGPAVIQTETT